MAKRKGTYKPVHDPSTPKEMRERLDALDPESREAIDTEAKRLVNAMHERGARMFGIVSAYELLEKLYKFEKAVELDLQPDLRKKRTLIGLAKSVK
jgi:hypothetical protein